MAEHGRFFKRLTGIKTENVLFNDILSYTKIADANLDGLTYYRIFNVSM